MLEILQFSLVNLMMCYLNLTITESYDSLKDNCQDFIFYKILTNGY